MRAVVFEAFEQPLSIVEVDIPTPLEHGVVIKVESTGLCRSDWHGWMGHDSDIKVLPHTPGHEFAGVVHAVGSAVTRVAVGDRVTVPFVSGCGTCDQCATGNAQVCPNQYQPGFNGPGSFAEFVAVPWADFNVVQLPDDVSFDVAASLGCRFATSYRAVHGVGKVQAGEWVAVFGCGGVGLAAIMIAKAAGARVVAVDINAETLKVASELGADLVVNASEGDVPSRIVEATGGAHVSIDALGSINTARDAVMSLRIQGRHVQVGLLPPASVQGRETIPMGRVIWMELQVLGSHGMSAAHYPDMLADIAAGKLAPQKLITGAISLDEVPRALPQLSNASGVGVTVIHP